MSSSLRRVLLIVGCLMLFWGMLLVWSGVGGPEVTPTWDALSGAVLLLCAVVLLSLSLWR